VAEETEDLFLPEKSLTKKERAKSMLDAYTPAAVNTLVNDLESPDWKARQAAANSLLEKAGLGSKGIDPKNNIPTINFDLRGIIDSLKQVKEAK